MSCVHIGPDGEVRDVACGRANAGRGVYYVNGKPYDDRVCGGGYGITGRGPFTSAEQLGDFHADARVAITQAPDYFVWWYTAKSIGLGVTVGIIGFLLGRASKR